MTSFLLESISTAFNRELSSQLSAKLYQSLNSQEDQGRRRFALFVEKSSFETTLPNE